MYFYTAEINFKNEESVELLKLIDKYDVELLRKQMEKILIKKCTTPRLTNAIYYYQIAIDFRLDDLACVCLNTFKYNFDRLIATKDWLMYDITFIKLLLNDSNLIVPDELTVFDAACKWLTYKDSDDNRAANFEANCKEIIPLIRFSQLYETQLFLVENCKFLRDSPDSVKELIRNQVFKAYRFRCLEEVIVRLNNKERLSLRAAKRISSMIETNNNNNNNNNNEDDESEARRRNQEREPRTIDFFGHINTPGRFSDDNELIFKPNYQKMGQYLTEFDAYVDYLDRTDSNAEKIKNLYSNLITGDSSNEAAQENPSSPFLTLNKNVIERSLSDSIESKYLNTGHGYEVFDQTYIPRNYTEICMGDRIEVKNKQKVNMQYDAKLFKGLTPKAGRNCEWKMQYKTSSSTTMNHWIINLLASEKALIDKIIRAQVVAIVYDKHQRVIQVETNRTYTFEVGTYISMNVIFNNLDDSKQLLILVKQRVF